MVGEVPVRVCLDELRDSTEPGAAQALARERRIALLGTAGVASGLVAVVVDGQDGDRRRSLELFEALIELARIDEESRGRLGARFLEEAATSIEGLALLDGIAPAVTHGLTMAYARADVEAPEALGGTRRATDRSDRPAQGVRAAPAGVRKANGERRGGSVRRGRR